MQTAAGYDVDAVVVVVVVVDDDDDGGGRAVKGILVPVFADYEEQNWQVR